MAFDYTNYLENATQANNGDFSFTDRAGNTGDTVKAANTAGEWCEENGSTTSSGTGPGSNPPGRAGFIYAEASTPAVSDTWAIRRTTSFDNTTQNVFLDLIYNLNIETATAIYIEYATVASPNETTDWTILETIYGTLTDSWISDTFDFSGVGSTSTLWIRVRMNDPAGVYTNDFAISTWREYGVDTTTYTLEGITKNVAGAILGSCELFLFKDNQNNTISFVDYTTSDPSTGAYSFTLGNNDAQYLVRAWKDDSPHVFDVTDHNLLPKETPDTSYDLYLRSDSDKGESSPDNDLRLRSDVEKLTTDPLITNAGDEDFLDNETDIDVVGINFGDSQTGSADIEIGDNATYGSCVDIESQTVNSWSDTGINIDINFGSSSLEYGSNWLYVTESGGTTSASYAINLYKVNTISDVSPSEFVNGTTGITITGSDFGDTKGSSVVYLADQADGGGTNVEQTTTDWGSTSITFTCVQGGLSAGPVYVIVARNNAGLGDTGARFSNGYAASLYETPTVTNIDDEDLVGNETNVLTEGTNFGTSQGSGYVELGNNSSYASCTVKSTQSIDAWNDTQIQVDIVLGSLGYGSNWCFVTNGGASRNDPGYAVNLYKANTISSLSPGSFRNNDTTITISGSDFGDTKGSSVVYLADQADGGGTNVEQTTTDWSSTSIEFTCVQGGLSAGTVYVIVSRNNTGLGDSGARFSNGYPATLLAPPAFNVSSSGYVSNDTDTTPQLSAAPSGDFSAGKVYTTQNPGGEKNLPADGFTEYEWCLQATTSSEAGAQYEFRLSTPGKVILLNKIPKVTISSS